MGCFTGVVLLGLANTKIFNKEDQIETNQQFYFGLAMIFATAILFSVSGVLTRKMKAIHFSVIQFNYGFLSVSTLSIWLLIECL